MNSLKQLRQRSLRQLISVIALIGMVWAPLIQADNLYFVHNDHLGTPAVITDDNQQVVWQGDKNPFGETEVTVNQIEFNVRFPGQYYDQESGLHYNYFRDYDPSLGRYVQSDPIGLKGGLNTFAYAGSNAIANIDPLGLDFALGVNPSLAGGNGHTTLYMQDGAGDWSAYDQGASGDPSSGPVGYASNVPGGASISPISAPPEGALIYPTSPQRDKRIMECAQQSQNRLKSGEDQYHLLSNNCTDSAVDVLGCAQIKVTNSPFTPKPNSWFEQLKDDRPFVCQQTRRGLRCHRI